MHKAQGPGVCKLPKPPASRALCQAKRAPRAAFPRGCLAAQTKRWAEVCRFVVSCTPSWFWGPVVTLEDCLAAFFAADELKGEWIGLEWG